MIYDLFIIGGGINGTAIARDAAGRGFSVFLAEQNDLASGTSSASTKLIHGGLRYLEHYKFRLVREALIEREVLLKSAPHIIWPLRFVLPHHSGLRPRWLIRLGLFIYDHLGGRKILPPTRSIDLRNSPLGDPLKPVYRVGYEYSDCWVQDSRLTVLNAVDARQRGAEIRTRTACVGASRNGDHWTVNIKNELGQTELIEAKAIVNAAGPWVSDVLARVIRVNEPAKIRMVKGSHIVVDKLYDHDRCYFFQNSDGRIGFAIPYEQNFTLIGTTDEDYHGEPGKPEISGEETDYLLAAATEYFKAPVTRDTIRWSYSGIRPLYDDGASKAQEATRDYVLKLEGEGKGPFVLSVFGGKITTSRKLAEAALERLADCLPPKRAAWTASAQLPGAVDYDAVGAYVEQQKKKYPFLEGAAIDRLFRSYGNSMDEFLQGATSISDLQPNFGPLSAREVDYLVNNEWAVTTDDILWRRSKLGLQLSSQEVRALRAYLAAKQKADSPGSTQHIQRS